MNTREFWVETARCAVDNRGAQQKPDELADFLGLLADRQPKVILEIGSCAGGTLWAWSHLSAHVIGVDDRATAPALTVPLGVHAIVGDSHQGQTVGRVLSRLEELGVSDALVDVLFIDGDHSYGGVRRDYELWSPLVRPGGIIAFHDVLTHPPQYGVEVDKLWAEITTRQWGDNGWLPRLWRRWQVIAHEPLDWGGLGILYV